jgi:hypothetical protein
VSDDYVQRIRSFLDRHDIANYRFVQRAKHRAVRRNWRRHRSPMLRQHPPVSLPRLMATSTFPSI